MDRPLLQNEVILLQLNEVTITNFRVWERRRWRFGLNLKTISIGEIAEIRLVYRRPILKLLQFLARASVVAMAAYTLPPHLIIFQVNFDEIRKFAFASASVFAILGLYFYIKESALLIELKPKHGGLDLIQIGITGKNADPEYFEGVTFKIEEAIVAFGRISSKPIMPPIPKAA